MTDRSAPVRPNLLLTAAGYGLMILATIGGFWLINYIGQGLSAGAPAEEPFGAGSASVSAHTLLHVLLALAAVIALGRALGWLFAFVHQPPVIGEVIAGILLGPSLLGYLWPEATAFLLPKSVMPTLAIIAQLGVILYMFVVGLELDTSELRRHGHATLAISHASIVVPFLLGGLLALGIYPGWSTSDVPFTAFALFLGVSMSVTAFPVLARILTDRQMHRTPLGILALACAAVDDVTAWCLLAFVVGVAQSNVNHALTVGALTVGYIAVMFLLVRPIVASLLARYDRALSRPALAAVLLAMLLSAAITETIGIHAIFGAFLLGAMIPHESQLARDVSHRLGDLVTVLLLPAFFAVTGMRTQIALVSGWQNWLLCGVIILVATLGKFGGTLAAARLTGSSWRVAAALGVLMNTRGLMGLIVLTIGLDLKVISPTIFAMSVITAIVTTVATSPLLHRLCPQSDVERQEHSDRLAEVGISG